MSTEEAHASEQVTQIAKLALKLPPIWTQNIRLWFIQVESNFDLSGITQDLTKYNNLVAVINPETLSAVSDILLNPPTTGKYEALKERLIAEYADSNNARIQKLLSNMTMGDERPSHLLRRMRELAGESVTDEFLKNIWCNRLPLEMQTILSVSSESLDNIAKLADKIAEVRSPHTNVFSTGSQDPCLMKVSALEDTSALRAEVASLQREIQRLSRDRSRSRSRGRWRYRESNRRSVEPGRAVCWYHSTFGEAARKCIKPCSFQSNQEN